MAIETTTKDQAGEAGKLEQMKDKAQAEMAVKAVVDGEGTTSPKPNGVNGFSNGAGSGPTSPTGPASPPVPVEVPRGRKAIPCRFFHEGRCRYALEGKGDECAYSHILPWDEATMGPLNKDEGNGNSGPGSANGGAAPNGFPPANGHAYGGPPMPNGYPAGSQPPPQHYPPPPDWQMYPPSQPYPPPPGQQQSGPSPPNSAAAPAPNGYEHPYYGVPYGYPGAHGPNGYGPPPPMPPYGAYYPPPPMAYGPPPPNGAQPPYPSMYGASGDQPPANGFDYGSNEDQSPQQQPPDASSPPAQPPYPSFAPYPPVDPSVMSMDPSDQQQASQQQHPPPLPPQQQQQQQPKVNGHERTASLPHHGAMYPPPPSGATGPMSMRGPRLPPPPANGFSGRGGGGGGRGAGGNGGSGFGSGGPRGGRGGMRSRYSTHDGGRMANAAGDDVERGPRGPCSFFDRNACAFCDECLYAHVMPNGDDAREYGRNFAGPEGPLPPGTRVGGGGGGGGGGGREGKWAKLGERLPKPQDFDPRAVKGYDLWVEKARAKGLNVGGYHHHHHHRNRYELGAANGTGPTTAAVVSGAYPPIKDPAAAASVNQSTAEIRQRLDDVVQQRRDGTIPASSRGGPGANNGNNGKPSGSSAQRTGVSAVRAVSPNQRVPSTDDFPALGAVGGEGPVSPALAAAAAGAQTQTHRVALPTRVVEPAAIAASVGVTSVPLAEKASSSPDLAGLSIESPPLPPPAPAAPQTSTTQTTTTAKSAPIESGAAPSQPPPSESQAPAPAPAAAPAPAPAPAQKAPAVVPGSWALAAARALSNPSSASNKVTSPRRQAKSSVEPPPAAEAVDAPEPSSS